MKPRVNNPAWVQAIQDVLDLVKADAYPPDQLNADPERHRLLAVPRRHRRGAHLVGRRRLERTHLGHLGRRRRRRLLDQSRRQEGLQLQDRRLGGEGELRAEHGLYRLGCLRDSRVSGDEKKRKAAWSAAAHLGGKDLSLWTAAYPSGFQPYRNSHFQYDEWEAAGYDRAFVEDYLGSNLDSYNHPNARDRAAHPRHLPVLLDRRGRTGEGHHGQYARRRKRPTPSPPPGRRSPTRSAATTRSSSTRPRSACSTQPGVRVRAHPFLPACPAPERRIACKQPAISRVRT